MKKIVMIGTATAGGISSVASVLLRSHLSSKYSFLFIPTHIGGNSLIKALTAMKAWLRYMSLLISKRVCILHVHMASRASFWRKSIFVIPSLAFRLPVLIHFHGGEFPIFFLNECGCFRQAIVRKIFKRVSYVVVLSKSWEDWVKNNLPGARTKVIYNPVTVPVTSLKDEKKTQAVLFLGKLSAKKGVFQLINAFSNIASLSPCAQLWLGGDGESDQIRAQAETLGIRNRVELLGWVTGEEKEKYLRQATVFALPSYNEGLPMAVLEAMSHGLPVVATPVGGIPEAITDGEEGFLVPPGDEEALADRLRRLLSDPDLRERMGRAARNKVERLFSVEVVVPQFEALYQELLSGSETKSEVRR